MPATRMNVLLVTLVFAASGCANSVTTGTCTLDILLANDDGWDAPGIRTVHRAPLDAGHRVTLVAPLEQQSGRGGAINTRIGAEVAVVQQAPDVWSVDGTPTDAVRAALDVVMRDDWPDLVVSGANFGPNLGQEGVHSSGTLGAALAAHFDGLPAIAVSTGIAVDERDTSPPFKSTFAGFETSASIVVNLINELAARNGCERVLAADVALNVNVPVPVDAIQGVRYATLSRVNVFRLQWEDGATDGVARIGFRQVDPSVAEATDDVRLFAEGYVTITPINGDLAIRARPATYGLPRDPSGLTPATPSSP